MVEWVGRWIVGWVVMRVSLLGMVRGCVGG